MKTIEEDFWLFWGESPEGTPKREKGEAVLGFIRQVMEKMRIEEQNLIVKPARIMGSTIEQLTYFYHMGMQGKSAVFATLEGNFLSPKAVEQAMEKARQEERERIEKIITDWNPFCENHDKCVIKESCIGYQQAESDFENEKVTMLNLIRKEGV